MTELTKKQRSHLIERLTNISYRTVAPIEEPDFVKFAREQMATAEKVIKDWETNVSQSKRNMSARIKNRAHQVKSVVMFKNADAALAAVDAFDSDVTLWFSQAGLEMEGS